MKVDKERVKRLILTDYLDNYLEEDLKNKVSRIIVEDEELSDFLSEVQNKTVKPFSQAENFHAPERIWSTVEGRLDNLQPQGKIRFWSRWLAGWPQLRLIWAEVSFAIVLILVVTVTRMGRQSVAGYDKDLQIEYLMLLTQGPSDLREGNGELKTNIEKFFL